MRVSEGNMRVRRFGFFPTVIASVSCHQRAGAHHLCTYVDEDGPVIGKSEFSVRLYRLNAFYDVVTGLSKKWVDSG